VEINTVSGMRDFRTICIQPSDIGNPCLFYAL